MGVSTPWRAQDFLGDPLQLPKHGGYAPCEESAMLHRVTFLTLSLLVPLAAFTPALAEEEAARPAYTFDEVNPPLQAVLKKAAEAKKPIFLEFFADG